MSSRISSAGLSLLLAACGGASEPPTAIANQAQPVPVTSASPVGQRVECAAEGAAFVADCTVERIGDTIVLRHADGGFRRLRIDAAGIVTTADGAVAAEMRPGGEGLTEIAVDGMRYRLPTR